jgi:hypothetical protein
VDNTSPTPDCVRCNHSEVMHCCDLPSGSVVIAECLICDCPDYIAKLCECGSCQAYKWESSRTSHL